jgi:hypothetical protein
MPSADFANNLRKIATSGHLQSRFVACSQCNGADLGHGRSWRCRCADANRVETGRQTIAHMISQISNGRAMGHPDLAARTEQLAVDADLLQGEGNPIGPLIMAWILGGEAEERSRDALHDLVQKTYGPHRPWARY